MVGSPAIAALVAQVCFVGLLVHGWAIEALSLRRVVLFVALWLGGRYGFAALSNPSLAAMFPSFVAILDIALVFLIFKRDIRLT